MVENSITKNKNSKPIDKKQLVIKIMTQLFNLNLEADRIIVGQQIDYLINNNMIMKIPLAEKILKSIKNYFKNTISWMMKNFISNSTQNYFPIQINNRYQIIINYSLIKFGLPKSTILIILMFL